MNFDYRRKVKKKVVNKELSLASSMKNTVCPDQQKKKKSKREREREAATYFS